MLGRFLYARTHHIPHASLAKLRLPFRNFALGFRVPCPRARRTACSGLWGRPSSAVEQRNRNAKVGCSNHLGGLHLIDY